MEKNPSGKKVLMLHKLKGYEVTRPKSLVNSQTIYSLLPSEFHSGDWVPVGRLDKDSTGLLLFVKAGPLVYRLQSPGNLQKVYEVWVKGRVHQEQIEQMQEGVKVGNVLLKALRVDILGVVGSNTLLRIILDEGKNRHIRKMIGKVKDTKHGRFFKVFDLSRISIGPVALDLQPGGWRFLTEKETDRLLDFGN